MKYLLLSAAFVLMFACQKDTISQRPEEVKSATFESAAIASASAYASQVGKDIMANGGNAIDAAVAVQFALAVVYPVAGNIGGGGFMLYRTHDGQNFALDFRETAPQQATRDMYLDTSGNVIQGKSLLGAAAVGVPGSVMGMWEAYMRFSKIKDWKTLLEPAIKLAEEGYLITQRQADLLNRFQEDFKAVNNYKFPFAKDTLFSEGDIVIQKDLANTLRVIAEEGAQGFYSGPVAQAIVTSIMQGDGIMTTDDLLTYKAIWRKPLKTKYDHYHILSMPPPSSGGIALNQLLQSVEQFDVHKMQFHSVEHIHLFAEAERRVYADRATHLGDPDFYSVPVDTLLSQVYNDRRMQDFNALTAGSSDSVQAGNLKESEQTTHFSIVDSEGNAVSLTTTINTAFGSKLWVKDGGFFLNNEMDDFSAKPGVPNYFGLIGNEANSIAPGKRMLSSMCPAIVTENEQLRIVTGTPGGSTIITSVFQVICNILEFGFDANEATQACRFHHQWLPDMIQFEEGCISDSVRNQLLRMGHQLRERTSIGKVETIVISDGQLNVAADHRGNDSVAGF